MNKIARRSILALFLVFLTVQLSAQEFHADGSMKLTEVSKDKKYGYESNSNTAIKVGSIPNEYAFLKALRGPNGESIQYRRLGSCCGFKYKTANKKRTGLLDKYEIYYQGLKEPIILYINGYEYESPKCPYGFTFKTAGEIEKPTVFPQDSILQVPFCDGENIFSVKESLLKEKIGEFPIPDSNPEYEGGIETLKKYFAENPLTDERAKDLIIRVAIGFVVNCEGKAGNFEIVTRGKGELETLANQVLGIVNNMPQNWKPAKRKGESVDCYQVLSFTVLGGQLDDVSYR